MKLKSPYPYFGGKSAVAADVWARFGDVPNYVEPFFGSGAVLLARPHRPRIETVNDSDGFVSNFWRAVAADPEAVARHADWPVSENDLHARHRWLVGKRDSMQEQLESDPEWFDAKIAGWWVWGISIWIGGNWCPVKRKIDNWRPRPHLSTHDQGIHRKRPHLRSSHGIHRQLPALNSPNHSLKAKSRTKETVGGGSFDGIAQYLTALAERFRSVRVCSGDWLRVVTPSVTYAMGGVSQAKLTAIFLDPPYQIEGRAAVYAHESDVFEDVWKWALENGENPALRIALCGYDDGRAAPDGWETFRWTARGGYGAQSKSRGLENRAKETIWFSPHCLKPEAVRQERLFTEVDAA